MIHQRFYFAGKIEHCGWRDTILPGPAEQAKHPTKDAVLWEKAIFGLYDYTGPYFVDGDHNGWQYAPSLHGRGDNECGESMPGDVVSTCLSGIDACDVIFAWIDCADCYGTLAEIGYAKARGKTIWIAGPNQIKDLWFIYTLAERCCFGLSEARDAFLKFIPALPKPKRIPIPAGLRFEILRRDDYRCQLCGSRATDGEDLHIDHRVPVARGGTNDIANLWTLCRPCNLGKGAQPLDRWMATQGEA